MRQTQPVWRSSLMCQERFKICKHISKWLKLHDVVSTIRHFSMYNFLSFLFTSLHILAFLESLFRCLQGPSKNIVPSTSRLISFKEKLALLKYEKSKGDFDCFSSAYKSYSIRKITKLLALATNFKPSLKPNFSRRIRIINKHIFNLQDTNLTTTENDWVIDLSSVEFYVQHFSKRIWLGFGFLSKMSIRPSDWKLLTFFWHLHLSGSVNWHF